MFRGPPFEPASVKASDSFLGRPRGANANRKRQAGLWGVIPINPCLYRVA